MGSDKPAAVIDSWCSISDKTVFILDRSTYFTHVHSGHSIIGESLKDPKKTTPISQSIEPFHRSLWTCTVEAVVGYSRLVWDVFTPDQRSIAILSVRPNHDVLDKGADPNQVERICTWQDEDQSLDHLLKSLARTSHTHQIRPPQKLISTPDISSIPNCKSDSAAITSSIEQALSELSLLTSVQLKRKSSSKGPSALRDDNNGRVILISSFDSEQAIHSIVDKFEQMLNSKNESLKETLRQAGENSTSASYSSINYCDLVVINTFPIDDQGPCSKIGATSSFRPNFHYKIFSVKSGTNIAGLLNNLCLQHHNLRSTTITGIPMKEEQNASSSSQYDVEIVHCSSIHEGIINSGNPLFEGLVEIIDRNGFPCDTFKLSWCTPRNTTIEMNHCVAASRMTPMDLNSRPSSCLTNFLLNGRTVMLEIFKSKSNRMTTHILACHNGELYIQSLAISQPKLNITDPPSIIDNLGGKVGDYRINDFVSFMNQHILSKSQCEDEPLQRTVSAIKRHTLYWPLTLGHTILLNIPQHVEKILKLVPKETLNQTEADECKKVIDDLIRLQKDGQALPSVTIAELMKTSGTKGGTTKLDQLYKLLWNELEYFLRVHSTTQEHEDILDYLLERKGDKRAIGERGATKRAVGKAVVPVPAKRAKQSNQLLPEINENNPTVSQTAMFFKTGLSLWQTWTQLSQYFNRNKNKLPFVGRIQPIQQTQQHDPLASQ